MSTRPWFALGIDAGSPDVGLSIFELCAAGAELRHAAHVAIERPEDRPCPICKPIACRHEVEPEVVDLLCDAVEEQLRVWGFAADSGMPQIVIAEQPQSFGGPERGQRSVLLGLAVMAALLDRARCWTRTVYQYTPAVWKGNKPKDEHQRLILARLTDGERMLLPRSAVKRYYISDPLDATGLVLWWLERTGYRKARYHCAPGIFAGQVEPLRKMTRRPKRS